MRTRLRQRLTYANVMSTLAVFIALGGSSYAALTISGSSIENRSIPGKKLKRNTITGKEVRESRLNRVPRARAAERLGGFSAAELRPTSVSNVVESAWCGCRHAWSSSRGSSLAAHPYGQRA